jgi:dihydrofolate synthase/folylpolyglutamate synthase
MQEHFSEAQYGQMIDALFHRFPSFQKVGAGAYKPGIGNMEFIDQLLGHPHRNYKIIHVAGTNGKGSVSNMLTSALAASGYKVGLYTSPHILDFRERIRICHPEQSEGAPELISKQDVWNFVCQWQDTFDHLDMSFFEITTAMALNWFAVQKVDYVVLETGLGGRLDSTNIVNPVLSVITNIGLDHCDMLGGTLPEIAFEKAGIIKPKSPVVIGESHPEIDAVFERKVLYTNLPEAEFMGNRAAIMSLLTFADKAEPSMWQEHEGLLARMDLRGSYQQKNLRTVLAALDVLSKTEAALAAAIAQDRMKVLDALAHTASRTGFAGRWQKLSDDPYVICDIGHNGHGLKYNFAQLAQMKREGECSHIIIVYGSVADKDVDAALELMPEDIVCIFTQAQGKRAMPAEQVKEKYLNFCAGAARPEGEVHVAGTVLEAVRKAMQAAAGIKAADPQARPLIYVGGSTYVVAEAAACIR